MDLKLSIGATAGMRVPSSPVTPALGGSTSWAAFTVGVYRDAYNERKLSFGTSDLTFKSSNVDGEKVGGDAGFGGRFVLDISVDFSGPTTKQEVSYSLGVHAGIGGVNITIPDKINTSEGLLGALEGFGVGLTFGPGYFVEWGPQVTIPGAHFPEPNLPDYTELSPREIAELNNYIDRSALREMFPPDHYWFEIDNPIAFEPVYYPRSFVFDLPKGTKDPSWDYYPRDRSSRPGSSFWNEDSSGSSTDGQSSSGSFAGGDRNSTSPGGSDFGGMPWGFESNTPYGGVNSAASGSDQNATTAQENAGGSKSYFGTDYDGSGYRGVGSTRYPTTPDQPSTPSTPRPKPDRSDRPDPIYGDRDPVTPQPKPETGPHSRPEDIGSVRDGTCFAAGTQILLADGGLKPVEQIALEDQVMAFDGLGALEPREVTDLYVHGKRKVLNVDGVRTTPEHPFLTSDGRFVPVGELSVGDEIVKADGSLHKIEKIFEEEGLHTVYNFTVTDLHTYVADGLRVHNKFVDPVILDLDGNGIEVTRLDQSTIFMDAGGDGLDYRTAWAASGDGVLFYDPDGRNEITEKR